MPVTAGSYGCSHQRNTVKLAAHDALPVVAQKQRVSSLTKTHVKCKGHVLSTFYMESPWFLTLWGRVAVAKSSTKFLTLRHFLPNLRGYELFMQTDKTLVIAYINHQGRLRSRPVQAGVADPALGG